MHAAMCTQHSNAPAAAHAGCHSSISQGYRITQVSPSFLVSHFYSAQFYSFYPFLFSHAFKEYIKIHLRFLTKKNNPEEITFQLMELLAVGEPFFYSSVYMVSAPGSNHRTGNKRSWKSQNGAFVIRWDISFERRMWNRSNKANQEQSPLCCTRITSLFIQIPCTLFLLCPALIKHFPFSKKPPDSLIKG